MRNTQECYVKLIEGKKLRLPTWPKDSYITLNIIGGLINQSGDSVRYDFCNFRDWEEYEEAPERINEVSVVIGSKEIAYVGPKLNEIIRVVNKLRGKVYDNK